MAQAMVSMIVAQMASGTVGRGGRLIRDHMPRSGYPRRARTPGCAALIHSPPKSNPASVPARYPKPHAHRTSHAANRCQDASAN